mmetsp:Transcript_47598/g.117839  ORF Transcript_47598/g.117839 Transcript_47598/m.117839 type:complete len:231 (-) Transcript_47598:442-1134(-)
MELGDGRGARRRREGAQVPDAEAAVVGARGDEVVDDAVPRDDVDVDGVPLVDTQRRAVLPARVPHAERRVAAGGEEDVWLDRRPLQVLHGRRVPHVGLRVHRPAAAGRRAPHVDFGRTVARRELALLRLREVNRVPLVRMPSKREERLFLRRPTAPRLVQRRQLRREVPHVHFPRVRPRRAHVAQLRHELQPVDRPGVRQALLLDHRVLVRLVVRVVGVLVVVVPRAAEP